MVSESTGTYASAATNGSNTAFSSTTDTVAQQVVIPVLINAVSTDNVLDRTEVLIVSGTAAANAQVALSFAGRTATAAADANGNWTFNGTATGITGSALQPSTTITAQTTVSGVTTNASSNVTVFSLLSTSPVDNGYLSDTTANLTLTFNQATAKGTGNIELYNAANTLIQSFDVVSSTLVTGWGGNTLTINPTSSLTAGTGYYVKIAATAIKDTAGDAFAGMTDTTTFNFTTTAADGSVVATPTYAGATNSSLGKSVSSAGDVNGDGYDDFIIGANSAQSAYVVYGNAAGTPPDLVSGTIASSRGFQISGGVNMGQSVSSAGDVNGDGLADLIVGAGDHTNNTASVVYGAANRTSNVDVNATSFTSSVGFKITGQTSTYLGSSVSGAGDVNGDGFADVIVGAITDAGNIGSAYVIYGTSNGANVDVISGTIEPRLGFKIIGEYDKRFGHSVSSAGDVNGDGYGDVIVGNLLDNDAYVVYGAPTRASFSVAGNAIAATNGFRIVSGETAVNSYGYSVSSVGDVNGDGFGDVMAANFKSANTFVIYGSATGTTVDINSSGNLAVASSGMKIAGLYGLSGTSAGDVNGDGLGDMLIGSSVINSGYAYVIYGTTSNTTITVNPAGTLAANIGFKITAGPMHYFGEVASAAGDINGDGLGDLLIGSRGSGYTLLLGGTQWVTTAVTGSGTVTGTSAAEAIIGSTGEDTLTGGGGVDRFFAGMGNDTIVLTASDVTNFSATTGATRATVHGGTGFNTLRLSGGTSLDLTTISNAGGMGVDENSRIESIERIDLGSDAVANTLTLAANDIKDMAGFNLFRTGSASADGRTWTNVSGTALRSTTPFHQLVVDGGNTDSLALNTHAGVWTNVGTVNNGTNNYAVYQNTATNTQVLVQEGVAVSVPPVLLYSSPSDNAYMLALGNNITLTFDQAVEKGTGTIGIYKSADNSLLETAYDVASSGLVTGWGTNKLTINPSIDLTASTGYYVKVSSTAVRSAGGASFIGINDATSLNFSTAAADGSVTAGPAYAGQSGSYLGYSVSGAGDVNGDGFDDYIVSAHSANSAFVVYGDASGSGVSLTDGTIAASKGFKISGGNSLGWSVSGVGDFNGDGLSDVVVGSYANTGSAYVVYGNSTGTSVTLDGSQNIAVNQGFKITGAGNSYLGYTVSGAGDVNGDGLADLMINGPGTGSNAVNYVVYGRASSTGLSLANGTIGATDGFKIHNVDWVYPPLSSAGDVNGDGFGDVLLYSTVIYGNPTGTYTTLFPPIGGSSGFNISSTQSGSNLGSSSSSAGDVNGDGLADVVIGAYGVNSAYVVFGTTTGANVSINGAGSIADGSGFRIAAPSNATSQFGSRVAAAGDMNGDGLADVVIGASSASGANFFTVVYGKADGTTVSVGASGEIADTYGFRITNVTGVVSSAGDINGDGLGDLIFGSGGSYSLFLGGMQWVGSAVTGSGTITGTSAAEAIIGSGAADTLTGGGGVDRFYAGQGNDTVVLTASDVSNLSATTGTTRATVQGGGGFDTIRLSGGAGLNLSRISNIGAMGLEENSRIESIERIDLATDSSVNALVLAAKDVKDMTGFNLFRTGSASADGKTWTNVSGTALSANTAFHQLQVDGGNTDSLVLNTHAGTWTNAGTVNNGTSNYTVYQNDATDTQVLVQAGVSVSNTPVMLAASNPVANGYLTALGNNLTLTFDQAVLKGTGTIQLFNSATGALVEGFDVASSTLVTGWGTSTLTINPTADLTASTGYYLKVTDNAVQNAVGSTFAGFANATTYRFSTATADGSVAATVYTGPASSAFGFSVSGAGDVNGDGYGDFIVGTNVSTGGAYVVYGDATGLGLSMTDGTIAASKGFKISGSNSLGRVVSGIGDVNGDGLDDVIVGSSSTAGAAYVIYGNSTGTGVTLDGSNNIVNSSSGFKITGKAGSYLGTFVSGAGDVNGDGLADFIVGAYAANSSGSAYVVYGKTGSTGLNLSSGSIAATDGFQITGSTSGLGVFVSSAGDVNADGLSDVIVSDSTGVAYVVYGNASGTTVSVASATIAQANGFKISSVQSASNFARIASSAGDVNGDGLADVVVSGYDTNSAYVIYGNASGTAVAIDSTGGINSSVGFRISTPTVNTISLGSWVSSAGDVNGDGLGDLIIGTNSNSSGAYVVYGNATGTAVSISSNGVIDASNGFLITGSGVSAGLFGYRVSSAGDINGDGLADLLVGSNAAGYSLVLGGTQWVTAAVSGGGTVTGTASAEAVIGSAAADNLTGGGGVDRFYAGMGNDTIVLTTSDVTNLANNTSGGPKALVNGGGGFDTIRMSAGAALDLTAVRNAGAMGQEENSRIESIERIDLATDAAANTLTLTATDVKDMAGFNQIHTGTASSDGQVWTNVSGSALGASTPYHQLVVDGSSNDVLVLSPDKGNWFNAGTVSNGISNYNVYQNLDTNSQVLVQSGVVVTNNDPNAAPVLSSTSATLAAGLLPVVGGTAVWNRTASYGTSSLGGITTNITATGDDTPTRSYGTGSSAFMWIGDEDKTETLSVSFDKPVYQVNVEFDALNYDSFNREQMSFRVNGVELVLSSANLSTLTYSNGSTAPSSIVSGNVIIASTNNVTGGVYSITSTTAIDSLTVIQTIVSGGPSGAGVAIKYNTAPLQVSGGVAIGSLMPAATDTDSGVVGYAITRAASETGADTTPGKWEYFNGSAWISLAGASVTQAVYLNASTLVRWNDNDQGYTALSAVAVDITGAVALGQTLDVTTRGGATSFSSDVVTLSATVSPVVIDLNRDGVLSYGQVTMDVNGDGHLDLTAWAGAQDGVLVWDKFADGLVHDNSQYAFAQYATTYANGFDAQGKAPTDLSGLAEAFDTNLDGLLNAQDAQFAEFMVWQDANQNGVSDVGEVRSLADWGITEINLVSDGVQRTPAAGVIEAGRTTAMATDGSRVLVSDAAFEYTTLHQQALQAYQVL